MFWISEPELVTPSILGLSKSFLIARRREGIKVRMGIEELARPTAPIKVEEFSDEGWPS